ncbi:hypothetical protein HPB49_002132 [Dermacentor silvarum]|uniref:Uncharacterized protein n=1 Tax=Dermacentor silvarum TaxID=543639 RepID=A0ACB8D2B2_DERSI|nr:hypothetical protein HPB49_002132 [Dermacentor silvarum]
MVTRLTSHEMLQLIARLRGLPSTAIEEEVSFIEGKVGLRNVRDERVDKLRPCDKRKLSVGLALVGSPKLVILNECTREIDPMSRGRLFRCIEKMHSCAQTSMVFASHCLRECDSFCDRVAVLESGEFQVIGETSLLKEGCKQRFTVTVRLTKDKVQEGDYIKTVNRVMKEQFPSSLISDIRMEDYVVCEASLADVFLGFSHERKVVDFSGADMRIYSDSEPIEVFSDVPPTPTLLRQVCGAIPLVLRRCLRRRPGRRRWHNSVIVISTSKEVRIEDDLLQQVCASCFLLERLEFNSKYIRHTGTRECLRSLKHLTRLSLTRISTNELVHRSKACPTIQTLKINSVQNGNNVTVAQALEAFHKIKLRILSVTATAAPDGLVSRSGLTPGSGRLESWNASTGNNSS